MDATSVFRGLLAEVKGLDVVSRGARDASLESIRLTAVVDAKDTYDRVGSDTKATKGAQKSMAFSVAALRQEFRRDATTLRWTHTENMVADALTKSSPQLSEHLREFCQRGYWFIEFVKGLTKTCSRDARRERLRQATLAVRRPSC